MASIKRVGKDKDGIDVWEVVYRRTPQGKQVRRRIHAATKREVERLIALDCDKSGIDLRWSEGWNIYRDGKKAEGRDTRHLENVERAVGTFIDIMGDIPMEQTTSDKFKFFMQSVVKRSVKNPKTGKVIRLSGPKVANHHRKELLTVARYILRYTDKISEIPFRDVPTLPTVREQRKPVPKDRVNEYLDALPPHVRRPVLMVLIYGLRSSAVCNLTTDDITSDNLHAIDKSSLHWDIPIDELLRKILDEAEAYRTEIKSTSDRIFVNSLGRAWLARTLLRAAQAAWKKAGLELKKIHEIRHTLGTIASTYFPPGMVQAAMRHTSRKSSEAYFHPDEGMAAEVRQKIITELSQKHGKTVIDDETPVIITNNKDGIYSCPCCGGNVFILKEKGRKP